MEYLRMAKNVMIIMKIPGMDAITVKNKVDLIASTFHLCHRYVSSAIKIVRNAFSTANAKNANQDIS